MVRELRMSSPQNRYYLRSCDQNTSGESTPDNQEDNSGDSSSDLSDLETETELDQNITVNPVTPTPDMASEFHINASISWEFWGKRQRLGGLIL